MVSIEEVRKLALSFEEVAEKPHFEITSFTVKKKIFATLNTKMNRATLKFTEADQYAFCVYDKTAIYPVPNKWGKQGWTTVELKKVRKDMFKDALTTAYCTAAPALLAVRYQLEE